MKNRQTYKAVVRGMFLDDDGYTEGLMRIAGQFHNKSFMFNWSRWQINLPNTKPTSVQFFVLREECWELIAAARVKIPAGKKRRRLLMWK